ncbi:MAG: hypothetical protein LBJ76_07045 [Candidatus Accumulibacter sp.]|nr:hypothetical protein [Accumulibacter sp.]
MKASLAFLSLRPPPPDRLLIDIRRTPGFPRNTQDGSALLIFVLVLVLGAIGGFFAFAGSSSREVLRIATTSEALFQAREALIGFAITYRDLNPDQDFGYYLPCPDTDDDGLSNGESDKCGAPGKSTFGRLPWKTLGLPIIRDGTLECLWYAVSGVAKDADPKPHGMNWDTPGQFVVRDVVGSALAGGAPAETDTDKSAAHDRPLAVILAPHTTLASQTRSGENICGSFASSNYLEGFGAFETDITTLTIADARSASAALDPDAEKNNDRALWITTKDIFDRIKRRSDFKVEIDAMMNDLSNYLNALPPVSLPAASTGDKGIGAFIDVYRGTLSPRKAAFLDAWRDNLLYAGGPSGSFILNKSPASCRALLLFSGERVQRTAAPLTPQSRATVNDKNDPEMYLEGSNAVLFPLNENYTALSEYDPDDSGADIARCINGQAKASASFDKIAAFSFAGDAPITIATAENFGATTVSIAAGAGMKGGCFWNSDPIPFAGSILRAYYEFRFGYPDEFALGNPVPDRGYGFTFQIVKGDTGVPTICGENAALGAIKTGPGAQSILVETDIHHDETHSDPQENHTAILSDGDLGHAAGTLSNACNGSLSGCRHTPANAFEETPEPSRHNQRIEIFTGCDSTCASCTPASHASPGRNHAQIAVWSDCADCSDIVMSMNRVTDPPTIRLCREIPDPEMNSVHFGLTAGLRAGASPGFPPDQSVVFRNLRLRSE